MQELYFKYTNLDKNNLEQIFSELKKLLSDYEFSSFGLGIAFPDSFSEDKVSEIQKSFQSYLIKSLAEHFNAEISFEQADMHVLIDLIKNKIFLSIKSVFIYGRYNKYSRKIAQTFHHCYKCKGHGCGFCNNSGKLSEESVQELLESKILPLFASTESKFHGAGREDADVLMLGTGRPFIFEVVNPKKRSADLSYLENEINSSSKDKVSVSNLSFCHKSKVSELKELKHWKRYYALIEAEKYFDESRLQYILNQEIDITQRTPTRVSKRRPDLMREKKVIIESYKKFSLTGFRIQLKASHGLYVKEFISGDNLRTIPNLSSILEVPCICKELDVIEVLD